MGNNSHPIIFTIVNNKLYYKIINNLFIGFLENGYHIIKFDNPDLITDLKYFTLYNDHSFSKNQFYIHDKGNILLCFEDTGLEIDKSDNKINIKHIPKNKLSHNDYTKIHYEQ